MQIMAILRVTGWGSRGYKLIPEPAGQRSARSGSCMRPFVDLIRKTSISVSRARSDLSPARAICSAEITANRRQHVIARAISQVHDAVKEGESIVQPLEASGAFPPMVISMIDVGEETGQLPEMLLKIAEVYDDEVDNSVAALTSLLEPIMIVMLALIVGTIVIALFMPLISITVVSAAT